MAALQPYVQRYQQLATRHGIADIFQDNGGKTLQVILTLGIKVSKGREGNDAVDEHGNEYELKTVNSSLTSSFSTHHHLNPEIIAKYRLVDWYFAIYRGIVLDEIYYMPGRHLRHYFDSWERQFHEQGGRALNNPKIPISFVREVGFLVRNFTSTAVLRQGLLFE